MSRPYTFPLLTVAERPFRLKKMFASSFSIDYNCGQYEKIKESSNDKDHTPCRGQEEPVGNH